MAKLISLETMHKIFMSSEQTLLPRLHRFLGKFYNEDSITLHTGLNGSSSSFVYAKGTDPFMLVAHLDTVHRELCTEIKYKFYRRDHKVVTTLSSPQGIGGDDRCGVILILSVLTSTKLRPSILFTCGEETGGHGAREFTRVVKSLDLNYIVEFDRRGNTDVVRYQDDSLELTQALEKYGFNISYGSFSDISVIAPHYGISAVNLSSGYYNAHTTQEYVCIEDMQSILDNSVKFFNSEHSSKKYKYKERSFSRSSYLSNFYNPVYTSSKQLSFTDDFTVCSFCGELYAKESLIDTTDGSLVCDTCANHLTSNLGYIKCPSCGILTSKEDLKDTECPFCGGSFNNED
jgi:hypothetical protein